MRKKIIFVCIANYCRSPVAEKIMTNLTDEFIFDSCGLHPIDLDHMDPRSKRYLNNKGVKETDHRPKKISDRILKEAELIVPMDVIVLNNTLLMYKKYSNKIKVFNFYDHRKIIHDPYKFNDDKYEEIMENINLLCKLWISKLKSS